MNEKTKNCAHLKLSPSSRDLYLLYFSYEVKYELVVADQTSLEKLAKATDMVSTSNIQSTLFSSVVSLVTPVMFTR